MSKLILTRGIDSRHLPEDPKILQQMVLYLMGQLDRQCNSRNKIKALVRELLDAKRNRKSEQLSVLFAAFWQTRQTPAEAGQPEGKPDGNDDQTGTPGAGSVKRGGRQALPVHLKRERIVHDLGPEEKHCPRCAQDLRPMGQERCER